MPRPGWLRTLVFVAAPAFCAALPPAALHGALAAAAGTILETLPFLLLPAVVPAFRTSPRAQALLELGSCGCGRTLPGALALPALGLCWLAFGGWVTLARAGGAVLLVRHRRRDGLDGAHGEPLGQLLGAGMAGAGLSLVLGLGGAVHAYLSMPLAGVLAGAVAGSLAPCATAGVALAAAAALPFPWVAGGLLATAGIVRPPRRRPSVPPRATGARAMYAALAIGAAWALCEHGAGLVSPRLLPLLFAAVPLAAGQALQRTVAAPAAGWGAPIVLFAALVLGSPQPAYVATATTLEALYPAESVRFFGQVYAAGGASLVQRFAITCCRADAAPVALRTEHAIAARDGTWLEARGTIVRAPDGFALRVQAWHVRAAPADPFIYR